MADTGKKKAICGLVMPISQIDGCSAEHWADVKEIICEALRASELFDFSTNLVSDADDVGVIQKRIVQNLYTSDLVVCDVSAKNPNVMFELGMRLAFDKPTIIVKDDKTDYMFDTGVIEHITYPRDLRFQRIQVFQTTLLQKSENTLRKHQSNSHDTSFLKNFGTFNVASIEQKEVPADKLVINMLEDMSQQISGIRRQVGILNIKKRDVYEKPKAGRNVDGMIRLVAAVRKKVEGLTKEQTVRLIADIKFADEIMSEIAAPEYFDSINDFRSSLDSTVQVMADLKD